MIHSLTITLAQGLALHNACIEVSSIELQGYESRSINARYSRDNGELTESQNQTEATAKTVVTGLTFEAKVWVNVNTKEQNLASFDLLDKEQNSAISINFDEMPELADFLDNGFEDGATKGQRLEATCEKYIKDFLVNDLKA